ncbi:progesterone receptor [Anoplopoma fimbria]|uniref:progesterone receptor n=1 Tax=Anoplopoma fimbria TaxID=229290 RepID=UPI0023EB0CAD|nr:progesterone receptor [Anoplopoma fimbria]
MNTISTSTADSTDTRVSDYDPQSRTCMSSSVRHFGTVDSLFHDLTSSSDGAVFKDCSLLDASAAGKQLYEPGGGYVKCDSAPWEDFAKVQRTNESLPCASLSSFKFIKDEKEPSVIMDTHCHTFDPSSSSSSSSEILALDTCCDPDRKDGDSTGFSPAGPRPGLDGSPNFLLEMNQSEQLPALSQVRTDSRSGLMMYKSEVPRWQTAPAEPQYWRQSAGMTDDLFTHGGYEGVQTQALTQRNQAPFSTFPGMPPQRLCVICGDEASGCHYGVLTCGSCKVFFKRAVEGHHSYLCAGRNDCIVDKIRRKNCPACRLRKCYQAGMMLGGRKLKRFGALKSLGFTPSLMFQSHLAMSSDNQALTSMSSIPGIREVQLSQQILNILENIEPETLYSGYDSSQSEGPHILLNSLNRLCEKQLLWIVKWSKSLPGFRNLHITDQMTLIQYSWMNLMVFSLGWRSYQNVTSEYLYFAPDLILSQEQMRRSPIYDLCLAIQFIPQEFSNLQVTREEFLCMKAIILLNTVPLEGLKSQAAFEDMRQNYIRELTMAIHMREKGLVASSQRFYHLTKLMDAMHDIVKKVNLFCLSTYIQADAMRVEFPEMMSEVIASQLPKVLAGMVRPLVFHTK